MKDIKEIVSSIEKLASSLDRPVKIMEVCGTHTMAIFRHGIKSLLPKSITLLSGPGCPVCVTSIRDIDIAVEIARMPDVTLATFGDMMRVPGSEVSLYEAKAEGADVRVVYSPLDAMVLAEDPDRTVVFFAAGFETTAPLVAATLYEAERLGVENFLVHSVHKTVPPALGALLSSKDVVVDGFLLPGHVSTIIGLEPYKFIAEQFRKPGVIAGFDAPDILEAVLMLLDRMASGNPTVEIQYKKVVREEGNPKAVDLINQYFEPCDSHWRGLGVIPGSALCVKEEFAHRDAQKVFGINPPEGKEPAGCRCGDVLRGAIIPPECPLFGRRCVPENPVGACMVSIEGSCSVYYKYGAGASGG